MKISSYVHESPWRGKPPSRLFVDSYTSRCKEGPSPSTVSDGHRWAVGPKIERTPSITLSRFHRKTVGFVVDLWKVRKGGPDGVVIEIRMVKEDLPQTGV